MQKYVLGFCFNEALTKVALIEKQKPDWQKGALNGIGGKIEEGERPIFAMRREFLEEAGVSISTWSQFCTMWDVTGEENDWHVTCFYTTVPDIAFSRIKTMEVETVRIVNLKQLHNKKIIRNLSWLIPLALDHGRHIEYEIKIVS